MQQIAARNDVRGVVVAYLLACLAGCGGGGPGGGGGATAPTQAPLAATFVPGGAMVFAVEAQVAHADLARLARASFTVRTKPGNRSRDVHVTFERGYLERTQALDAPGGLLHLPVFGLYAAWTNEVLLRLEFDDRPAVEGIFDVPTGDAPDLVFPIAPVVEVLEPDLELGFLLLQGFRAPAVVDVDGELRWMAQGLGGLVFPRIQTPEGMLVGTAASGTLYRIDWLGRARQGAIADPRVTASHHNFSAGKSGVLNTVRYVEDGIERPLSVLIEMTTEGHVLKTWNFDAIFRARIAAAGEDATGFVDDGVNWFHMNAAAYSPTDDSLVVSSRENFVVKVDYETGAIRWLLGNPGKLWCTQYPASLQPLALQVIGDPPIGQHAVSLSPDGRFLMLFDNGWGNSTLPDVGDSRDSSRAVIYRIDEEARTAEEVWSFEHDPVIHSATCSSAYPTAAGDVLVVFSQPEGGGAARLVVVDGDRRVRYEATLAGPGCSVAYAAEEIRLDELLLE